MSSILDALEKVEAAERWKPQAAPPRPEGRSKLRLATIAAGAAFAAGAAVAVVVLRFARERPASPEPARLVSTAPVSGPAGRAHDEAAPVPRADVPPPVVAAAASPIPEPAKAIPSAPAVEATPPSATDTAPAAPSATDVVPPTPAAVLPSPQPVAAATVAPPAPPPEAPRRPVEPAAAPAAPAVAPRQPALAAVEPRREPTDEGRTATRAASPPPPAVRLSFLVYSPSAERRSVVLTTEGGSLTTLHEGERVGDIEVARILPDSVELRYEGRVFTVRPR